MRRRSSELPVGRRHPKGRADDHCWSRDGVLSQDGDPRTGLSGERSADLPVVVETVVTRLTAAGCVAADEEAAKLVSAFPDEAALGRALGRREEGEPLAWITGKVVFCGLAIQVGPEVFVPRRQSEGLARRAVALLAGRPLGATAVDLCTGTGAIAACLATAVPGAVIMGVDIDRRATSCARRNGVEAVLADATRPPLPAGSCDVVTAIAPYVPSDELRFLPADTQRYEPRLALDGGEEGLAVLGGIVAAAAAVLRRSGWFLTEISGHQVERLGPALLEAGFGPPRTWTDSDGDVRGLAVQLRRH